MNKKQKKRVQNILLYFYVAVAFLLVTLPFYLLFVNGFKSTTEIMNDYFGFPENFAVTNFVTVMKKANFLQHLWNSVLILVVGVIGIYIVTPITSFVIARRMNSHKYFRFLYYYIILGMFVPFQAKMLALVKVMSPIGLMNIWGLILLYIFSGLCVNIMLMVGYIQKIPLDIEEAAMIDGCSRLRSIFTIVYPLVKPMTAAVIIKEVLWMWNDFFMPSIVLSSKSSQWTLQLFLYNFTGQYYTDYGATYAAFLMSALPILIIYIFAHNQMQDGLASGSVKG